jgi:hypothetical protein
MQDFDQIEDFLFGRLSGEALTEFQRRRKADAEFEQLVQLHILEHKTLALLDEKRMREKMQGWKKDQSRNSGDKKQSQGIRWIGRRVSFGQLLAAACIALLIGVMIGKESIGYGFGHAGNSSGPLTGLQSGSSFVGHLIADNLIQPGGTYHISLTTKRFRINGTKQSDAAHKKYVMLYEQLMGFPLTGEFKARFEMQ